MPSVVRTQEAARSPWVAHCIVLLPSPPWTPSMAISSLAAVGMAMSDVTETSVKYGFSFWSLGSSAVSPANRTDLATPPLYAEGPHIPLYGT